MKRRSQLLALASTLVLLLGSASLSQADQILISAGFLQQVGSAGSLEIAGNRGFTLFCPGCDESEGLFVPGQCQQFSGCPAGSTLPLTALWVGSAFEGGTATLDGQSYSVGIDDTDAAAFVEFTGSVVLPPLVGDSAFVSAPFLFSGLFHPSDAPTVALRGRGTATLALRPDEGTPGHWALSSARYEFQPIPEPGTMFLVGGGLAALAARARKRRKKLADRQ